MTYDLKNFHFTFRGDDVTESDIIVTTGVNALTGSDQVTGTSLDSNTGIDVQRRGRFDAGFGDDLLQGKGTSDDGSPKTGIANAGSIWMGFGNDRLEGIVEDTANGDMTTTAEDLLESKGIYNAKMIDMGFGDDKIFGDSGEDGYGIFNDKKASIYTGFGNDEVTGSGGAGHGISNDGLIDTGFGDDVVAGESSTVASGFTGDGLVRLGMGNDAIHGFGSGHFDGGPGRDQLLFTDPGTYSIGPKNSDGFYDISLGGTDVVMHVKGFERIGELGGDTQPFDPNTSFTI